MTDDELWTVTPIPRADLQRADVRRRLLEVREDGTSVFVFDGPVEPWHLAALVPDPLRRRTLLDRLCWWRR